MCWDYSECCNCGKRTPCTTCCYCSDLCTCGAKDCKSHDNCRKCGYDICEECYYETDICGDCKELVGNHPNWNKCCQSKMILPEIDKNDISRFRFVQYAVFDDVYTCRKCFDKNHNIFVIYDWKSIFKYEFSARWIRKLLGRAFGCKIVIKSRNHVECVFMIRQEAIDALEIFNALKPYISFTESEMQKNYAKT